MFTKCWHGPAHRPVLMRVTYHLRRPVGRGQGRGISGEKRKREVSILERGPANTRREESSKISTRAASGPVHIYGYK